MVAKLAAARVVRSAFYLVLDADVVLLRPLVLADLVDARGRGLATFSPFFSGAGGGDDLRSVGQFGRWLRWSGDVLGIPSVDARRGFYGVTPALLHAGAARALWAYLERRHGDPWWANAGPFWTEYGLYFLFLEATQTADAVHFRCEGQLSGPALWEGTADAAVDASALARQNYALFAVDQSRRRGPRFDAGAAAAPRLGAAASKRLVLDAWAAAEAATDRSRDDRRRADGSSTASLRAFVTHVATVSDVWAACVTAASRAPGGHPHVALADGAALDDYDAGPLLRACFRGAVLEAPRLPDVPRAFGLLHAFGLARFDKVVVVGPGAVLGPRAADLFERPGLAASNASRGLRSELLVLVPDLALSYGPLRAALARRRPGERLDAFLDGAFPRWRARDLPRAFYVADDPEVLRFDFGARLPPSEDLCARDGARAAPFWAAHAALLARLGADDARRLRALLRPLASGALARCGDVARTCRELARAWDFPDLFREPDCRGLDTPD